MICDCFNPGAGRLLLFLLACSAGSPAQQAVKLNLEQCVRRALIHHPRLAVARSEVGIQESLLEQARAAKYRPQLDLNFMAGPVPGARGSPYDAGLRNDFGDLGMFSRGEMTALQPLYTFGKVEGKMEAARHGVEAAQHARQQAANEVRRETQKLYHGLLLARELNALVADALARIATARTKVRQSIESGGGQYTRIDEYRLDAVSGELDARRITLAATEATLLAGLKAATGFAPSDDFDIVESSLEAPERTPLHAESAAREALDLRPEMRQFRAGDQAMAALVRSARADRYPQFFAGGLVRYGYAPNRTDQRNPFVRDDFNFFQGGFGVGFRYSLNVASTSARVKQAVSERERLGAQQRAAQTLIDTQARNAVASLVAARLKTDTRQKAAAVGRRWLAAADSNFDLGVGETRDLVDAFQVYLQSRAALLEAIHDEHAARIELEYATGGR